ncbi:metallophosphoesterase [Prosthecobacter sp.]|uniref:metallophosphoesterase n=1 Tax=Prosthecobacter sp. TaxID=1965333 RepID=UPI001E034360|nr:metallophosphoesterase [Prosthecobacter sp.]MCB1276126.1 metallophosphoesterase [Prosthecobacter sp.]
MKTQPYDLIGDIHGQHAKLTDLLAKLGYEPLGEGFRHPGGRKVIFLGDYIDRGPKVREVLVTVRSMVESGDALAIMGNHEYNAVCWHTPNGRGGWLRPRRLDRDSGLKVTLKQFAGREDEWSEWLEWMRRLPMFLDLGELRAVHACWDAKRIKRLEGESIANDSFLHASAERGTSIHRAVDHVLKGPEMKMPEGCHYHDKDGVARKAVRVRWWDIPETGRISDLAMPEPFDAPGDADEDELRRVPDYGVHEPPVFFGHYWMPASREKAPLRHNLACLDFSAAREGPMVSYRWDGERLLDPGKFVVGNLN